MYTCKDKGKFKHIFFLHKHLIEFYLMFIELGKNKILFYQKSFRNIYKTIARLVHEIRKYRLRFFPSCNKRVGNIP